jgi:hypothetical protein
MKKIARKDIRGPEVYEAIRADVHHHIIAIKRSRRLALGPLLTLVFENRQTVIFQIEESLRAAPSCDDDMLDREIALYNTLVPGPDELSATLFVEVTDPDALGPTLERLRGIDEQLTLEIGPPGRGDRRLRARARLEPPQEGQRRLRPVEFVRFALTPQQADALRTGYTPARLIVAHPAYPQSVELPAALRRELARELAQSVPPVVLSRRFAAAAD